MNSQRNFSKRDLQLITLGLTALEERPHLVHLLGIALCGFDALRKGHDMETVVDHLETLAENFDVELAEIKKQTRPLIKKLMNNE